MNNLSPTKFTSVDHHLQKNQDMIGNYMYSATIAINILVSYTFVVDSFSE